MGSQYQIFDDLHVQQTYGSHAINMWYASMQGFV